MWLVGHVGAVAFTASLLLYSRRVKKSYVCLRLCYVCRACVTAVIIADRRPMFVVSFPAYKVAICAHIITLELASHAQIENLKSRSSSTNQLTKRGDYLHLSSVRMRVHPPENSTAQKSLNSL